MKVALIGDIHANLPALEAVLAHARTQKVNAIWNLGDTVGYGAFPDQVVQLLLQQEALSILGEIDLAVLAFKQKKDKWRRKMTPERYAVLERAYGNLSKKQRKALRVLSQEARLKIAGRRILLTHGSPLSNEEVITAATPLKRLRKLAKAAHADVVLCGHSHRPFKRRVDGVRFLSPGSVGLPDDGDPRASYALLRIGPQRMEVHFFRVEYDVERAAAALIEQGQPELAQMVREGRSPEAMLGEEETVDKAQSWRKIEPAEQGEREE